MIQVISEKNCVAKVLQAIWDIFLHENNGNYNSTDLVINPLLSSFCSILQTKTKKSGFQQVGGLVTRNISVFCLEPVAF